MLIVVYILRVYMVKNVSGGFRAETMSRFVIQSSSNNLCCNYFLQ